MGRYGEIWGDTDDVLVREGEVRGEAGRVPQGGVDVPPVLGAARDVSLWAERRVARREERAGLRLRGRVAEVPRAGRLRGKPPQPRLSHAPELASQPGLHKREVHHEARARLDGLLDVKDVPRADHARRDRPDLPPMAAVEDHPPAVAGCAERVDRLALAFGRRARHDLVEGELVVDRPRAAMVAVVLARLPGDGGHAVAPLGR
mmetsp:Transcript_50041/g.161729  ORF Transcript_50041/g.161729 Transcript_50041/m.161729 type:complete len:204 (+) Transcript_50041:1-612(+)